MAVPTSEPAPRFHLLRHFSLASLAGVLVVMAIQAWLFQHLAAKELVRHGEAANANLTQMFANTVWARHQHFLREAPSDVPHALRSHPAQAVLKEDVLNAVRGVSVVKVKFYDLKGITVFSTDPQQIGERKWDNSGYQAARAGGRASLLVHREHMDTFEGAITDRDLVSSYLPVRALGGAVETVGVIEVYSDVTDLAQAHQQGLWQVIGALMAALVALYIYQLGMVRRADRILIRQDDDRAAQARLIHHQAFHDALTGLPNRSSFMAQLGAALRACGDAGHPGAALMFLDLDRFKPVNDRFGHEAGDELLRAAAGRLRECLRDEDALFRIGGDEFTVILPRVDTPAEAAAVAARLIESVKRPFSVLGQTVSIGASIGLALMPRDGEAVDELLRRADGAMYRAKSDGRGAYAFYQPAMSGAEPGAAARPSIASPASTRTGSPACV